MLLEVPGLENPAVFPSVRFSLLKGRFIQS